MLKESTNLKDFHKELNNSNFANAYKIALFLKEKYLDLGGPQLALNYLDRFIEKYEIKLEYGKKKEIVKEKKISSGLLKWSKISNILPFDISQSCEKSCIFLSPVSKPKSISKLIFEEWKKFIFTDNKYVKFIDGWYSSTHTISIRIKNLILEEKFLEILQPSCSNSGYLESIKLLSINKKEIFLDINLSNPFLPLYFIFYTDIAKLSQVLFIPFPSLLRNGVHYCELLFNKPNLDLNNAITYYSYELIKNINFQNQTTSQLEDKNELMIDKLFLENYDIFKLFESLNIKYKDINSIDKKLNHFKNIFPSLKSLSYFKDDKKDNAIDNILFINKFDFTPLFLLSQPFQNNNINNQNKILTNFAIKGLSRSKEMGVDKLDLLSKYFKSSETKDISINKNYDKKINNNTNSCTIIIDDIFCENKLFVLIESLFEQKNIEIKEIILLKGVLSSDKIMDFIKRFDYFNEIILIFDFEKFKNYLKKINKNKVKKIIFISSLIKLKSKYTISYLIHHLDKFKDVSNISCGINTSKTYIDGEIKMNNKYALQISLPNLLNYNLIEFNEIDLDLGSFVNFFYPISNNKYFCIWDLNLLINSLEKIDQIENLENLLMFSSVKSILAKFRTLCITSILCKFQTMPVDNKRYLVSRELSELILSNYDTFYKSISIISKFHT